MKKTIDDIRKEELEKTKFYTDKQMKSYIGTYKFISLFFTEGFLWVVSFIPLIIIPLIAVYVGLFEIDAISILLLLLTHFLYWKFYAKKETDILINEVVPELKMMIQVLEEIRKEKFNKNE